MNFDLELSFLIIYLPIFFQIVSGIRLRRIMPDSGKIFNIFSVLTNIVLLLPFFIQEKTSGLDGLGLLFVLIPAYLFTISVAIGNLATWIVTRMSKKPSIVAYSLSIFIFGWAVWVIIAPFLLAIFK